MGEWGKGVGGLKDDQMGEGANRQDILEAFLGRHHILVSF